MTEPPVIPPQVARPCRALGCSCPNYNPGALVGFYYQCADCHHTDQIHQSRT